MEHCARRYAMCRDLSPINKFFHKWLQQFLFQWNMVASVFLVMPLVYGIPDPIIPIPKMLWPIYVVIVAVVITLPLSFVYVVHDADIRPNGKEY